MENKLVPASILRFLGSVQIQNILSMLGAEVVAKLSRIVTLIAMAAYLVPIQYGTAMLALACHDMIRLILRCGAGSQLVQCSEQDLPLFAQNAVVMQWSISILLAVIQYFGATLIADFYDNQLLADLLQQLAFVYLLYPLVSVRVFLTQRSNQLKYFGFCNGVCVSLENLSIALLLVSGVGIEAIVYGKFIYAVFWIALFLRKPVQNFGVGFHWQTMQKLLSNSMRLFQSEFSRSLRLNIDLFLAGKFLSPEIFGIYSFAKSASVAISQALSNAVVSALYPQCCKMFREGSKPEQTRLIAIISGMMLLAFVLQAALVPYYVPFFFADTWTASITPAIVLCLSAVPVFLLDMLCCVKRAIGRFASESKVRLGHLLLLLGSLLLMQPASPIDIAMIVLLTSLVWVVACLVMALPDYQSYLANASGTHNTGPDSSAKSVHSDGLSNEKDLITTVKV